MSPSLLGYDLFSRPDAVSEEQRVDWCCAALAFALQQLNQSKDAEVHSHLVAAVDNFVANARWRFVNPEGEKLTVIDEDSPLMWK